MTITKAAVKRLAHLARIELDEDHVIESIQTDLTRIVDMIDKINTANTEFIEPMAHPLETHQVLRKDKVTEQDNRAVVLALTPKAEAGLYLVPLMIEEA